MTWKNIFAVFLSKYAVYVISHAATFSACPLQRQTLHLHPVSVLVGELILDWHSFWKVKLLLVCDIFFHAEKKALSFSVSQ